MYAVVTLAITVLATGCGSRCPEVAHARDALVRRAPEPGRTADVELRVPFARANALIEALLAAAPLTVPLEVPALGPIELVVPPLTATARAVQLAAAPAGKVQLAVRIDIRDAAEVLTTLALTVVVEPVLERANGGASLVIGFGPDNLLALKPELGPDATRSLGSAVTRWIPSKWKGRVPQVALDAATRRLGDHVTGGAYRALQATLLRQVGEVTRLRLRLPDVPVARVALSSSARSLVVAITTDLAVRRGLADRRAEDDDDDEVTVRLSGSAAAELANWAIDQGHAPRWYSRSLAPHPAGEFRPRFDYVAEDAAHPVKVYAFQERGGCSYFRVGARATVALDGTHVKAIVLDRALERRSASPVISWLAWVKYFVVGWSDRSKRVAAHTRVEVRGRALDTRVIGAALVDDELRFALRFTAE
ncbi:MAG: hypothetical protein M3680_09555 [Myxococcota bacterium]|nr:hypothetical protein [Myxococcota bacterium]